MPFLSASKQETGWTLMGMMTNLVSLLEELPGKCCLLHAELCVRMNFCPFSLVVDVLALLKVVVRGLA
jgi:hypothetical protein